MSKRGVIAVILFIIVGVCVAGFGGLLWMDYRFHYPYGSAPFYLFVVERAIQLLVPAVVCFAAGMIVKGKKGE